MYRSLILLAVAITSCASGCEEKSSVPPVPSAGQGTEAKPAASPGAQPGSPGGHHGPVVDLGEATIGPYSVRATRDKGDIKPGGDAPIDVWLTGGGKPLAVRFWIGTPDAKGSVKAKAEIEDPKESNRWHTHAEVPDPLPADGRLWVEIEVEASRKVTGSFDLKK